MKQTERKNYGTMIVPFGKADVGASSKVIAKFPIGTRIKTVNATVDEAFADVGNTISLGVSGATTKFQNAVAMNAIIGNNSTLQHTVTDGTAELLMSIAGSVSATGSGDITIDYILPSEYSVEY
jgi:hypothetical protein